MKIKKQPETEMEYWSVIEALGGFIWQMNHSLSHGRIEDPDGGVEKDITSSREIQLRLVSEIVEKFGVIAPQDCPKVEFGEESPPAPEGKIYYWDWYKKMKAESYQTEYDGLICSACPFSEGVERMISLGGQIPCGVFSGSISRLRAPHLCAMVTFADWSEDNLRVEMVVNHGEEAFVAFQTRVEELKSPPAPAKVEA
ncbi:hypothetical protein HQ571_05500 [Candidatus Kuenenbacteria bacterium]|nr:hypothetical protein [Candidatus Kuenenbacteria bacterium]